MEAIRLTAKPFDGKLSITLPTKYDGQELEVIVLIPQPEEAKDNDSLTDIHRKRLKIVGKAPKPYFPITKYDAYNQ